MPLAIELCILPSTPRYMKTCHFYFFNSSEKHWPIFTRKSSYCFQRVLAIAILSVWLSVRPSVPPSVTRVDQWKTVQTRITKSSPLAAWKTLVLGTVKLFHKFTPERGRPIRCWRIISICRLTILKWRRSNRFFNDFVVLVIFWSDACTTQYEFIVVNGQTTTSAFHKVV